MLRAFAILILVAGCSHGGDENLGLGDKGTTVDVDKLTSPDELVRALSLHGAALDERLGPHTMQASQTVTLTLPTRETQTLDETFSVQSDARGDVRLVHDNSRGYGFEAVAQQKQLYVKPRYGKFVRERIEGDELARLRVTAETAAAADLRLLERFVQVRPAGTATVAGHSGVKLALSAKSSPDPAPAESEAGKKWRESVEVRYIDGSVVVDAKTGAPLAVQLDASYQFARDGKPVTAALKYKQTTVADAGTIVTPADYAVLGRPRPMLDRQQLLDGLK